MEKKVLLVTGESSGDLYGAHLIKAIHHLDPDIKFFGIGGDCLKEAGMEIIFHSKFLSVVGITEVIFKISNILKAMKILKKSLDKERPNLVILIDFPDFNLMFAKSVKKKGIPVVYYISPQIWAWRPKRLRIIAQRVNKMIVFLPFEVSLYESAGVDVKWIGHPLLDLVKPAFSKEIAFQKFDLDPEKTTIGLLPGSRDHEVKKHIPAMIGASQILLSEIPDIQFVIPLASGISRSLILPYLNSSNIPIRIIEGFTYDIMNISDLLITASGTATLEGAILGKPMVIIYKVSLLSYIIGRLMIKVDKIGLVNLVSGKKIVPELIQNDVTPYRIAKEALLILKNPHIYQQMEDEVSKVRLSLGEPGASERAAKIITSLLH